MTQGTASGILASLSSELADVVKKVAPSVVRVDDGSRLTATGILWSADGLVVTTSHGVERDDSLSIERADGTVHPATLLGRDPDTDIALLRIEGTGLPAIEQAGIETVNVGQIVLALGRPGHSALQATIGIIGARRESQTDGQPGYVLNTDAVLYPGFSGGPLVDVSGRMVGLTNRMFGRGMGVALGTPVVAAVAQALPTRGTVRRGYLGVRTQLVPLPAHLVQGLNLAQERGLLIVQVEVGSPAEQSGLMLGDTLLRIDDQALQDVEDLRRNLIAGQTVAVKALRGGALHEVNVTLSAGE